MACPAPPHARQSDGNHLQHEWLMMERIRLEDERQQPGTRRAAPGEDEAVASTAAVFDASGRAQEPGRGGVPAVGRAIDGLHASAGNAAIARLFAGASGSGHREGQAQVRAARTSLSAQPVVQRDIVDEPSPEDEAVAATDSTATTLADKPPTPGPSWTHVGPPSGTTFDVSGTLRQVANAVAARPEAGSETATPSKDTETWAPPGGAEKVTAARVTIDQVVELPVWTDKSKATKNQQAEWDRFHKAITTHEAGHVSTDKTSFAGTHAKMVGQAPGDSDTTLTTATTQAKTDNDAYDVGNGHGLGQGTGINPNIDEVTKVP